MRLIRSIQMIRWIDFDLFIHSFVRNRLDFQKQTTTTNIVNIYEYSSSRDRNTQTKIDRTDCVREYILSSIIQYDGYIYNPIPSHSIQYKTIQIHFNPIHVTYTCQ